MAGARNPWRAALRRPARTRACSSRPETSSGRLRKAAAFRRYSFPSTESALDTFSPGPGSTSSSVTLPSSTIIA